MSIPVSIAVLALSLSTEAGIWYNSRVATIARSRFERELSIGLILLWAFFSVVSPVDARSPIEAGTLLIASRGLQDPNFRETVVLIFESGAHGVGGVIVNRPVEMLLREVFPNREGLASREDLLWQGGPVLPRGLIAIVEDGSRKGGESLEIVEGISMIDPSRALDQLDRGSLESDRIRIFAGHAGWVPGQLEAEILLGGWELLPARAEWVFGSDPESLWETLVDLAGLPTT